MSWAGSFGSPGKYKFNRCHNEFKKKQNKMELNLRIMFTASDPVEWGCGSVVECLPGMQEVLGSISALHEPGMVHTRDASTQEVETRLEVQCHPRLCSKLEASLHYMRLCLPPPPLKKIK